MSDISSSDSDEFYDAEDATPNKSTRRSVKKQQQPPAVVAESPLQPVIAKNDIEKSEAITEDCVDGAKDKLEETQTRRKRVLELRQRLATDDDGANGATGSPQGSTTSSFEGGLYPGGSVGTRTSIQSAPATSTSHPFRIIEQDGVSIHSMSSIGRGALILSQIKPESLVTTPNMPEAPSTSSSSEIMGPPSTTPLQEPDVIASTKPPQAPVAPPRRKKKNKSPPNQDRQPPTIFESKPTAEVEEESLPSPTSTIDSLTRDLLEQNLDIDLSSTSLEHSLDLKAAVKGQYVVKPQDSVSCRAEPTSSPTGSLSANKPLPLQQQQQPPHSSSCSSGFSSACSSLPRSARPSPRNSKERTQMTTAAAAIRNEEGLVRTRSDSGKQLTDLEILEQVTVLNLDTGERVPLSVAEDKIPQCINPLSLHIMRLTSEYVSNSSLEKERESDEESVISSMQPSIAGDTESVNIPIKKRSQIRSIIGRTMRKTMDKAKHFAHEVRLHGGREGTTKDAREGGSSEEGLDEQANIKLKASHKGPYEFDSVRLLQDITGDCSGAIWCMRFSACGRLLATAGQDRILRIWVLRDAAAYFSDMCSKYSSGISLPRSSPTPSQESLVSQVSTAATVPVDEVMSEYYDEGPSSGIGGVPGPFMPQPFVTYTGHTSDLLDVSWSKNYFILSSSMDKTVRLWHISRKECLCCFQHIDFVTAIVFHPRDDRYFLSGSLDGKLRLWNIPDKKVAVWTEVEGGSTKLVTAANFCQNGKFAVIGTYDGRCVFYFTEQLKYHTQIHVRSSRGRNSQGRKITGIEPMPGEDKILVTSNDSRIRLYDLRDLNLSCKYKGYVNTSSQIRASFSHDGKYITSGSENQTIYIWRTYHEQAKFSSARRDRNNFWEGIKAHNAVVTCSVFAPHPAAILRQLEAAASLTLLANNNAAGGNSATPLDTSSSAGPTTTTTGGGGGYILVSADFNGSMKVFLNRTKPKHSSLPASAMA